MSWLPLLRLTQRFLLVLCPTTLGLLLGAGAALAQAGKSELLLYCGITMVRQMTEIAQAFEKRENVKVTLAQGGSEDLYQAPRKSGAGDLYLPGEPSYRGNRQFAVAWPQTKVRKKTAGAAQSDRNDRNIGAGSGQESPHAEGQYTGRFTEGSFGKDYKGVACSSPPLQCMRVFNTAHSIKALNENCA